jgi:hypothetical protein
MALKPADEMLADLARGEKAENPLAAERRTSPEET